jgi:hypothetical protein
MNDNNGQILTGIYRHAFRGEIPYENAQLMVETPASLRGINALHAHPLPEMEAGIFEPTEFWE